MQNINSKWTVFLSQTETVSPVLNYLDEYFYSFKALLWKHVQGKEVSKNC